MKRAFIISLIGIGMAQAASVKAGGTIFGYYSHTLSDPDSTKLGYNEFGIGRAYLDLKADFTEATEDNQPPFKAKARITYDAEPLSGFVKIKPDPADSTPPSVSISGVYMGFLKFAYGELGAFRGIPGELWFRIGQIPTPLVGYEEGLWGLRFVAKVMTDEYKILNSADRGLGADYVFPAKYGSLSIAYMNGEGFKSGEVNEFKDIAARLSAYPFAGLSGPLSGFGIHGYYHMGKPDEDKVRDRVIAGASYSMGEKLGLMFSYITTSDGASDDPLKGAGYSGWAWVNLGKFLTQDQSFGLFGRYDSYDPDADTEDDATSFMIAGAYYTFAKGWQVALDYQAKTLEDPDTNPSSKIYLHLLAQF